MDPTQPPSNGPSRLTRRKCFQHRFDYLPLLRTISSYSCCMVNLESRVRPAHACLTRPRVLPAMTIPSRRLSSPALYISHLHDRCRSFGPPKMSCPPEAPVLLRPAPGYTDPLDHRKDGSWGGEEAPLTATRSFGHASAFGPTDSGRGQSPQFLLALD